MCFLMFLCVYFISFGRKKWFCLYFARNHSKLTDDKVENKNESASNFVLILKSLDKTPWYHYIGVRRICWRFVIRTTMYDTEILPDAWQMGISECRSYYLLMSYDNISKVILFLSENTNAFQNNGLRRPNNQLQTVVKQKQILGKNVAKIS